MNNRDMMLMVDQKLADVCQCAKSRDPETYFVVIRGFAEVGPLSWIVPIFADGALFYPDHSRHWTVVYEQPATVYLCVSYVHNSEVPCAASISA